MVIGSFEDKVKLKEALGHGCDILVWKCWQEGERFVRGSFGISLLVFSAA